MRKRGVELAGSWKGCLTPTPVDLYSGSFVRTSTPVDAQFCADLYSGGRVCSFERRIN